MKNTHSQNKRRNFLKLSASTLFIPFILQAKASKNNYGIRGKTAPELDISYWIDAQGKPSTFKLANHKSKFIFMEFWQSWCPGCHAHGFPALKKISDAFESNEYFTAIAIQTTFEGYAANTPAKVREIQKQYALNIIMGHDAGDQEIQQHPKTMVNYRSGGTPWAVLISPNGKVIYNDFSIDSESAIKYLKTEIKKLG